MKYRKTGTLKQRNVSTYRFENVWLKGTSAICCVYMYLYKIMYPILNTVLK